MNDEPLKNPARRSAIWLPPPSAGAMWHSPQPVALNTGPTPSSTVSGPVNSSAAMSKLHSSSSIIGEFGEFVRCF